MARLLWDDISQKSLHSGIDRGVIYPAEGPGIPWSGLISVEADDNPQETRSYFLEGQKVFQDADTGDFSAAIQAFMYPDEFESVSDRFGLCYRTMVHGETRQDYILHILYNVQAIPKDITYSSINNSTDLTTFEWDIFNLPARVDGFKAGTHFTIDSRVAYPWLMTELEGLLYGDDFSDPRLPDLTELLDIFEQNSILRITDHGDGTWTAEGPPVYSISPTEFGINWDTVVYLDDETYTVSSL